MLALTTTVANLREQDMAQAIARFIEDNTRLDPESGDWVMASLAEISAAFPGASLRAYALALGVLV
jgi:hypothetical protein